MTRPQKLLGFNVDTGKSRLSLRGPSRASSCLLGLTDLYIAWDICVIGGN